MSTIELNEYREAEFGKKYANLCYILKKAYLEHLGSVENKNKGTLVRIIFIFS
jgi:hypothetical protein